MADVDAGWIWMSILCSVKTRKNFQVEKENRELKERKLKDHQSLQITGRRVLMQHRIIDSHARLLVVLLLAA
jgi:hypothetical protein